MRQPADSGDSGDIAIDKKLFVARFRGVPIPLTTTEFDLLDVLVAQADRVVTRAELLEKAWISTPKGVRVVDTFVSRLRSKLREVGHPGIVSIRSRGYRLLPAH